MRRFLVTCDDCDWRQTLTTEADANRAATGHARVHADPTDDLGAFVASHARLAHFHAAKAGRMVHESYDDVYADALVGLWDAARRWDPTRAGFSSFAARRIVGQIADGRRERDPLSRTCRGRGVPNPLSLDTSLTDGQTLADLIPDGTDPIAEFHDDFERTERHDALMTAINRLPPRTAYVIREQLAGRTLAAIAVDLDVTESRTCQMRSDAIHRLRALIAA